MKSAPQPSVPVTVHNVGGAGPLLGLLAALMPIRFVFQSSAPGREDCIVLSAAHSLEVGPDAPPRATLTIVDPARRGIGRPRVSVYSEQPEIPFPFKGRTLSSSSSYQSSPLGAQVGERILATTDAGPVWTVLDEGASKHFRSALPLPDVADDTCFFDFFNSTCFADALPLIEFLRQVSGESRYAPPRLRASFIVDDPNLHWPRYGFVDYGKVIARARKGNYHVCFATIPLDTWYTHKSTAALFRTAQDQVSLLVHGNNHARAELAARYSSPARHALLHQSIRRMERLSLRDGLQFSRVMVPPHGACDHDMLRSLPLCGFESACISSGSLRGHNPKRAWTKTLGYWPSETIEGCPVLPRWGLRGDVMNTILIAAYLGQAIVIMGHHQDLAGDMEELDRVAAMINGLGEVAWGDMTTMSRLNYLARKDGAVLHVRAHGAVIRLAMDCDTEADLFEPPGAGAARWHSTLPRGVSEITTPWSVIGAGRSPTISTEPEFLVKAHALAEPGLSLPLLARRLLTEARDRITPYRRRPAMQQRESSRHP